MRSIGRGLNSEIFRLYPVSASAYFADGSCNGKVQSLALKKCFKPCRPPHDPAAEIRFLTQLSAHDNIISLISFEEDPESTNLIFPLCPCDLDHLLNLPSSSNLSIASIKTISHQIISGLSFIHSSGIAHRDLNPRNILISPSLDGILISDFGVSISPDSGPSKFICDLGTEGYRAPELSISQGKYDPFALDLWGLGASLALFFTPFGSIPSQDEDNHETFYDSEEENAVVPEFMKKFLAEQKAVKRRRLKLFEASSVGDIAQYWAILKVRGSADPSTWPSIEDMPDYHKLSFQNTEPKPWKDILSSLNFPSIPNSHQPPSNTVAEPWDLIWRLLQYESSKRMPAAEALHHPWFDKWDISKSLQDLKLELSSLL